MPARLAPRVPFKPAARRVPVATKAAAAPAAGYNGFNSKAGILPDANWTPFANTSPWNLGDVATRSVHPNSAAYVNTFMHLGDMAESYDAAAPATSPYPVTRIAMNWPGHDVFHPIYWATTDDPFYTTDRISGTDAADALSIRMPQGAMPGDGVDGHLTVIQPDGSAIDFWQAVVNHTTHVIQYNIGKLWNVAGSGMGGGGTASGFPAIAGQVTAAELAAGEIKHALFITCFVGANPTDISFGNGAVVGSGDGSSVYPANSGDSYKDQAAPYTNGYTFPPMGCWIRLNMTSTAIDALSIPAWRKTILKALAKYGGFFGDTGGAGFGVFQFQSAQMYTSMGMSDPFNDYAVAHPSDVINNSGVKIFDPNSGVDWANKLQVVLPPNVAAPTIPGTPAGFAISPGFTQINLSWTPTSGATGYRVFRDGTLVYDGATAAYSDTTPVFGTQYAYTVLAYNDAGAGDLAGPLYGRRKPRIPANLRATPSDGQILIEWDASPDSPVTYRLGETAPSVTLPYQGPNLSFTDTSVVNGTSYTYQVATIGPNGEFSGYSSTITVVAGDPPTPPTEGTLYLGGQVVDKLYVGDDLIDKLYLGSSELT